MTGIWDDQAQAVTIGTSDKTADRPDVAAIAQRLGVIALELAQLANEIV